MAPKHVRNPPASTKKQAIDPGTKMPLDEGIRTRRYSTGTFGVLQYTAQNIKTDFAVANALQRVGRKISEDHPGVGEYIASLGAEFQMMERCQVYMALQQKSRESEPKNLERRIEVSRDGNEWCIDEAAGHVILPDAELFQVFLQRTPTVIDRDTRLRLVFGNMNIEDDKCRVENATGSYSSRAMMPFYYRDRKHASGIAVFEGDLTCRDSRISGFSKTYWTARLTMEMAAQISFQLTHRFDAITTLSRVQDFEVDIRNGIKRTVSKGEGLFLMLIDLDRFKAINTGYGYTGGDAVLREVAEAIKRSIRSDDSVTRRGGDEFTVILRDVSWSVAMGIGKRIMENVSGLAIPHNGESIKITCSMGTVDVKKVAEELGFSGMRPTDEQVTQVYDLAFERSNKLLTAAKDGGRDRVLSA